MGDQTQPENTTEVTAEQNTAEGSSTEEQTVSTQESEADSQTSENSNEEESSASSTAEEDNRVPYERFKEQNDQLKQLRAQNEALRKAAETAANPPDPELEEIKGVLKQLGFVSREELEVLDKQRAEDAELDKRLSKLEATYDGKDGRPKFSRDEIIDFYVESGKVSSDPEALYKLKYEKELIDWHVKSASSKAKGTKSEVSDGSGSTTVGTATTDLKEAALKGDKDAYYRYLKRTAGFDK